MTGILVRDKEDEASGALVPSGRIVTVEFVTDSWAILKDVPGLPPGRVRCEAVDIILDPWAES